MAQVPFIHLPVQFPSLQLLRVPFLPLPRLGQPLLPTFVADCVNVYRVMVTGMGRKQAVISVWRVDR